MKSLRNKRIRFVLVPVMAANLLSSCSGWTVKEMEPNEVISEKEPDRVRITTWSGREIVLIDPWVYDGAILGHPLGRDKHGYEVGARSDTVRVATSIVAEIEVLEHDPRRTAAAALGVGAFALLIAGMISSGNEDPLFAGCCR